LEYLKDVSGLNKKMLVVYTKFMLGKYKIKRQNVVFSKWKIEREC
jgi:hypothetical protein